jgi:predicted Zn-dependent peptidase
MPVDRSALPGVGPDPAFLFPRFDRHRLANGLEVRTVEHGSMPIVSFALVVGGGSGSDPGGREGLMGVVADMVDEGTGDLGAIEVSEALATIGGDYDVEVGADALVFTLTTLARFIDHGADLFAAMSTRPSLREADFERVRQLRRDRLRQLRDVPSAVAERAFLRLLYDSHPYGHLAIGEESALAAMTLGQVMEAHRSAFEPSNATLVVAGNLTSGELLRAAERAFGGWGPGSGTRLALAADRPVTSSSASRLALVPREGAAQSELRIGRLAARRDTPDYPVLVVMNAVVGGQFVSRINLKLREEKGYTYGARTGFDWRKGLAPFVLHASVHTATTAEAVSDALREFDVLRGDRPVTPDELELAKASLTRGYPQSFQTVPQVARAIGQLALYGLPDDYFSNFGPRIHAVTTEDVTRAARAHLDPAALTMLIVGDQQAVAAKLSNPEWPALEVLGA